jgi:hypothetical protein
LILAMIYLLILQYKYLLSKLSYLIESCTNSFIFHERALFKQSLNKLNLELICYPSELHKLQTNIHKYYLNHSWKIFLWLAHTSQINNLFHKCISNLSDDLFSIPLDINMRHFCLSNLKNMRQVLLAIGKLANT